jgi:hypothetical protein
MAANKAEMAFLIPDNLWTEFAVYTKALSLQVTWGGQSVTFNTSLKIMSEVQQMFILPSSHLTDGTKLLLMLKFGEYRNDI